VGIIRFRKLLLEDAKAYANGQKPESPHLAHEYCLRGGGAHTKDSLSLEEVMQERFNSITGKV
jgi:hypothetical protein